MVGAAAVMLIRPVAEARRVWCTTLKLLSLSVNRRATMQF